MWNKLDIRTRANLLIEGMNSGLMPDEIRDQFNSYAEGGNMKGDERKSSLVTQMEAREWNPTPVSQIKPPANYRPAPKTSKTYYPKKHRDLGDMAMDKINDVYKYAERHPIAKAAYDATNAGLYLAAPFTGGATLPAANTMSVAQMGAAAVNADREGFTPDNVIDIAAGALGVGGKAVVNAAGKPIMKMVGKNTKYASKAPLFETETTSKMFIAPDGSVHSLGKIRKPLWQLAVEDARYIPYSTVAYGNEALNGAANVAQAVNDVNSYAEGGEISQTSTASKYPYVVDKEGTPYVHPLEGQPETEKPYPMARNNKDVMHDAVMAGVDKVKSYMLSENYKNGWNRAIGLPTDIQEKASRTEVYDTNWDDDRLSYFRKYGAGYPGNANGRENGFSVDERGFVVPTRQIMSTDKLGYVAAEEFAHGAGSVAENVATQKEKLAAPNADSKMAKAYGNNTDLLKEETRAKMTAFKALNNLSPFMTANEADSWYKTYKSTAIDPDGILDDYTSENFIKNLQFSSVDKPLDAPIDLGNGHYAPQFLA